MFLVWKASSWLSAEQPVSPQTKQKKTLITQLSGFSHVITITSCGLCMPLAELRVTHDHGFGVTISPPAIRLVIILCKLDKVVGIVSHLMQKQQNPGLKKCQGICRGSCELQGLQASLGRGKIRGKIKKVSGELSLHFQSNKEKRLTDRL